MNKLKISPALLSWIIVGVMAIVAFLLRVCFSYSLVFKGDWIKYASADAYYHMRLVDITANNFPRTPAFDPYMIFPGGDSISGVHMFVRVMAGIASLFGLVEPSQRAIDIVGVFTPPVLAALTVIVVFFLGKELFGRWGGVLSALLLAIIPGEFFSRTKLSFTDYHCLETFLTALFILFAVMALKAAKKNGLAFSHLLKRDWAVVKKPLILSLIAGLVFAMYALTWKGAPMFIFIFFIFVMVQFIIDHLKKRDNDYLAITGIVIFLLPLVILLPTTAGVITNASLAVAILSFIVAGALSWFIRTRQMKPIYFPASLVVLAGTGFGIFFLLFGSVARSMLKTFEIFMPSGAQLTTIEMQPLISTNYGNALSIAWNNYNVTFFFAIIAMLVLVYFLFRKESYERTLLLVWSIVMLIANLAQRRFGYYYGVNVALLVGFLSWLVIDFARSRILSEKIIKAAARAKELKKKVLRRRNEQTSLTVPYAVMSIVVVVVLFSGYYWSIETTLSAAKTIPYAPTDAWCSVLDWVRENTPDPFEGQDAYYKLEKSKQYRSYSTILNSYPNETSNPDYYRNLDAAYPYPETAYGILAWWDYGYWISRIAHRLPNANPGQDSRAIKDVAAFFTAQDEETALEVAGRLHTGYVLIDYETAYVHPGTAGGKFWAVITWSGQKVEDFYDLYLVNTGQEENPWVIRPLYYPEYYRSMAVRMYNFDCQAVTPASILVIAWEERKDDSGNALKEVTKLDQFSSYEEAEAYIASQETGNYRIIGHDPLIPCTPIEALEHFKLEHGSEQGLSLGSDNATPEVKLFKYVE